MGWAPSEVGRKSFLILSTQGGVRAPDGQPIALGYHTGHWEIGLLVEAAARELKRLGAVPFAGAVSDPCDGRTQGTDGMFDSLPYRNDAAMVMRRLIRSPPGARRLASPRAMATARHDDGAAGGGTAAFVPGGVTLPPVRRDAGRI
jgi:dihydroxyacid dehydratase/phosphogluconate dehydratase